MTAASGKAEGGAELLPCPFCAGDGSADGVAEYSDNHAAFFADGSRITKAFFCNCVRCGVTNKGLVGYQTRVDAIAEWNRRAHLATPAANGPGGLPSEPHTVKKLRQWRDEGMNVHNDPSIVNYIDALLGIITAASESTQQPGMVTVPEDTVAKAARYDWIRHHTGGNRQQGKLDTQVFSLPTIKPIGDIMHGSVAEHLDHAIDALRSGGREEKPGVEGA